MSRFVYSTRGEETEVLCRSLEQRRESTPRFEVSDRVGDYSGCREAEVCRIQEMADLGPHRTRSRGSQDVTADKSEVGRAIRGPRGSGRVEPSDSSTISPVARIVLVMLWQILYFARAGTLLPIGIAYVILVTIGQSFHLVRRGTAISAGISCDSPYRTENCICIMYVVADWLSRQG